MISHEKKFIFFHVPKNGGTSVKQELKNYFDKGQHGFPYGDNGLVAGCMARHIGFAFGLWYDEHHRRKQKFITTEHWHEFYKFGFTRNPWDRAVSNWKFVDRRIPQPMKKRFKTFESYLEALPFESGSSDSYHAMEQWKHLCDPNGKPLYDFVGRLESLHEDFSKVCDRIGIEAPESMRHMRQANRDRDYRRYYTPKTFSMVSKIYAKDIEMWGYDYEGG